MRMQRASTAVNSVHTFMFGTPRISRSRIRMDQDLDRMNEASGCGYKIRDEIQKNGRKNGSHAWNMPATIRMGALCRARMGQSAHASSRASRPAGQCAWWTASYPAETRYPVLEYAAGQCSARECSVCNGGALSECIVPVLLKTDIFIGGRYRYITIWKGGMPRLHAKALSRY